MEGKFFIKCIACIVKFIDIPHDMIHDVNVSEYYLSAWHFKLFFRELKRIFGM